MHVFFSVFVREKKNQPWVVIVAWKGEKVGKRGAKKRRGGGSSKKRISVGRRSSSPDK